MIILNLIGAYTADQYFDVSFWLSDKGYRSIEQYYKLANTTTLFGWSEFWILNINRSYCIIKLTMNSIRLYIIDMKDSPVDKDRIIFYLETGKQLPQNMSVYDTPEYFSTSLSR